MTCVFQHKTEANRIKMIDAESKEEAEKKLSKRLSENPVIIIINGVKTFDNIYN